jgi:hypothetical protein
MICCVSGVKSMCVNLNEDVHAFLLDTIIDARNDTIVQGKLANHTR